MCGIRCVCGVCNMVCGLCMCVVCSVWCTCLMNGLFNVIPAWDAKAGRAETR